MCRLLAGLLVLMPIPGFVQAQDDKVVMNPVLERPKVWTPEGMMKVKAIATVQVSPDGKQVVYTVRETVMEADKSEYLTHIHLTSSSGTETVQLTQGDKSCESPLWSPDGKMLAFLSPRSGKNNVWTIRVTGGEAERLTDAKGGVTSHKWSPDGKSIAFTAPDAPTPSEEKDTRSKNDARVVDENVKLSRLFVIPVAKNQHGKREAKQLTSGGEHVGGGFGGASFDWSPDSRQMVFTHVKSPKADDWTTADVSVVDVESGKSRTLANTAASETSPLWSPDGRWIAYAVSSNPPKWAFSQTVWVVPAAGGSSRELAATPNRSFQLVGWSADGHRLFLSEQTGTTTQVFALAADGPPERLTRTEGVLGSVSLNPSRTHFGFTWQATNKAMEAHVCPADRFLPSVVSQVHQGVPDDPLGRTEVIRWKSADGLEVEGLLTFPVDYQKGKRYPLLLVIHGGPAGVYSQSFIAAPYPYPVAAFAAKGFAVLRCNPRGSTGYGQKFRFANYGDWGGGDFADLMAGVDHVIGLGIADKERLGVMGWSYGGFMTSWTITQTKRFKAASVGAGVTNLVSFTGTADIPSFLPDYFGGEFWENLDTYRKHSAMFNIKGVTTPTLIQHGERDDRVPIGQGYELYNALKRQGCPVKMVVYPRMPHGPSEPRHMQDAMTRNLEWFQQHLGSSKP